MKEENMTPEQTRNSADATDPARHVIDEASVLGRNRRILLATLVQAGAVTATATYVGCGDSGGVEDVSVEMPAEAPFDMAALVTVFAERGVFENGEWQTTIVEQQLSIEQALRDFADEVIDVVHGGWEDGEGSSGKVIFDCHAGMVRIEHTAYFTDSDYEETTL
ncbi:MAG: hypothetical protein Q8R98_14860 [Rubrivivax sp.]|jgi:hypothetical protein|nr:hypothetical protein [Rubrivivax sp.]MDP3613135.1 hypothetical protein [Rubrivivax sp.]